MAGFQPQSWNGRDVGIFHETYLVQEGQHECLYNNMPRFGLAKAGARPATGAGKRQAGGLAARENPLCPHLQIRSPESMAVLPPFSEAKAPALISFPAKHPVASVLPAARRLCLPASAPR